MSKISKESFCLLYNFDKKKTEFSNEALSYLYDFYEDHIKDWEFFIDYICKNWGESLNPDLKEITHKELLTNGKTLFKK